MNQNKYSIRDLERLTGVKTHTIRMWEKRYGIIQPERSNTNIRSYSDTDLQKLLNICILNHNGYKISHIAEMSPDQVSSAVSILSEKESLVDADINSMVVAAIELHEEEFDRVLNSCLLKLGFENTFCEVIFPLFEKLSVMWQIGRINACQERFITNLVRQKLLVATDGLVGGIDESKGSYLMFMPAGHEDEIGLLYANYITRKSGYQVVYLGPSVPFDHIQRIGNPDKFDQLFISLSLPMRSDEIISYVEQLRSVFSKQEIHVVTPKEHEPHGDPDGFFHYSDYEDFRIKLLS